MLTRKTSKINMNLFSFLWPFIQKQKWMLPAISVLSFMWLIDTLFWPFFLKEIVDVLTAYDENRFSAWPSLKPLLIWGASAWIIMDGGFRLRDYLQARTIPKLEADIRMNMFDHVQRHSPKYFNEHFSGSLANKIGDMAAAVTIIFRNVVGYFIPACVICIATVLIFAQVNTMFAMIVAIWIAIHFMLCWIFTLKCSKYSHLHGEARSLLVGKIVDSLTNNFVVNLFFRFRFENDEVADSQKEEQKAHQRSQIYSVKMFTSLCIALAAGVFTLTGFMIFYWMSGKISTGEVVQLFYTVWNVSLVMLRIADMAPEFFQALGIATQALSIMQDPQDLGDRPNAQELQISTGEIVFDNVDFHYGEKKLFRNKHVRIRGKEKVGLVGFTGAGKSTFINLILRFFPLHSGKILIDEQEVAAVSLKSLRRQIALIPQDPILFHRTLRENISYGNPEASEAEIIRIAKQAHCDEFIRNLPKGYESKVGERGTKLSGGEKQRIAIARAMLADAPILILDEATSSLDSVTERYIQDSLEKFMQNRTTIVIAHRLSTLSRMDRILVFDKGMIVEEGTHDFLLSQDGLYARMWKMQVGGFLPDQSNP
jgi:ATP-binding cassette subfamily B protein